MSDDIKAVRGDINNLCVDVRDLEALVKGLFGYLKLEAVKTTILCDDWHRYYRIQKKSSDSDG